MAPTTKDAKRMFSRTEQYKAEATIQVRLEEVIIILKEEDIIMQDYFKRKAPQGAEAMQDAGGRCKRQKTDQGVGDTTKSNFKRRQPQGSKAMRDGGGSYKRQKNARGKIERIINPFKVDIKLLLGDVSSDCKKLAKTHYDPMSLLHAVFEYVLMYGYDMGNGTVYLKIQSSNNLFSCADTEIEQCLENISLENVCSILGVPYIDRKAIINDDEFCSIQDDAWESRRKDLKELISSGVGIVQFAYGLSQDEANNINIAAKKLIVGPSIRLTAAQTDDIESKIERYGLDALYPPGHESQLGIIDFCNYMLNSSELSGRTYTLSSLMNEIIHEYNSRRKVSDINQTRSTEQAYKQGDGSMGRDPYICRMVELLHETNSGIKNAAQGQKPVDQLDTLTDFFAKNVSFNIPSDNSHRAGRNCTHETKTTVMPPVSQAATKGL